MRFAFTEEQEELRRTVRKLLDRHGGPVIPAPEQPDPGYDPALWKQLGEIGAHGLAVPEEHGGVGATLLETLIVVEELGRRLVSNPFLGSTVLSAQALLVTGNTDACARLLPAIADGERIAALAWAEPDSPWHATTFATTAQVQGTDWLLTGHKTLVLDAAQADVLLVVAMADGEASLFEALPESTVTPSVPVDLTRRMGEVHLADTPARLIGRAPLRRLNDVAAAAIAAEQIGAAQRWLQETVEYTKIRKQFGRPIGSFQAIKHRLADCYTAIESARSLSYAASWAVSTQDDRASELASMAKSACGEAYSLIAAEGVQLHGGIGITWEHEAHLHLKRAHAAKHLFGTPQHHRATLLP
ncbi:Acyl-CoA dehydrogenase [Saccharopolyspora kobensis]|uniref:Acyl-CoA dehydrogenase n=2 Tax=Saccharopolyspora kobensis TaxID=146035 RepID=A0A1H6EIR5_9PSEU|nr:acyl-CoA dehydrogenase family protein [Saccharopolyspora kobensis]SEG96624.1 Acyl-CoA dehydrogenase [Saccharopolyspora kobensis]SFF05338.1 Acyl-CoA dehydrogenase [Saccharopolyspora kobensis]